MKNSPIEKNPEQRPEQRIDQLEKKLRACQDRYNVLMENIRDGIFTLDTAGRFTFVNHVITERSGQPPEWFYERTYFDVIREADRDSAKKNFLLAMKGEIPPVYEFAYSNASGDLQWIETNVTPMFENGRIVGIFGVSRDINQRKKVETRLRKNQAMLNAVIESLPFDTFAIDTNNRYILQNSVCKKNWGNIIGQTPEDFPVDTKTKELWQDNNRRALSGETVAGEVTYETINGSRKDYYNIIAPIRDREKMLGIVGVLVEISELKRTQEALKHSEARYRTVVENQSEMVCCFLPDGTLTFANGAYCRHFNKPREALIGTSFFPLIPDSDREMVFKNISSLHPNAPVVTHEHRVVAADGEICWHQWTNRAIFDDRDTVIEYQAVGWDITDRVRAETALRESEERYRLLVETMNDGIVVKDETGLITYVNDRFCKMLNRRPDELIGRPVQDFLDDRNRDILQDKMRKRKAGTTTPYELEWTRKNGSRLLAMMSPQRITDEKGFFKGGFSVITDISDLKQVEAALTESLAETERQVAERTRELQIKTAKLEEINTALNLLLEKRSEDNRAIEEQVLANVKRLIFPYLKRLKKKISDDTLKVLTGIIESNLKEVTAPFAKNISSDYFSLTPSEIKVADLVRRGKKTKEIAKLLDSSHKTIERHRENIRKKMGIKNKKIHLQSYLSSLR